MRFRFKLLLFLCCYAAAGVSALAQQAIYKLPDLVVETNSTYLVRGVTTKLECKVSSAGEWQNITLDRIYWMKDGMLATELSSENNEIVEINRVLHIKKASHSTEGEYQCSAILREINLADFKSIDSRLVSAPVKLRRARITKFERYISEAIKIKAGEVARLPCFGVPDVVPGPPDIWFEKQGNEGVQLGRTGNQRFIATPTGLQIALTQVADSGRYYCMVRNSFLNVTRAAPKPIVLKVDPSDRYRRPLELRRPKVVYPIAQNYSEPIDIHAVEGETVILECVISDSVIRWNKLDYSMPKISIDNDRERIRQIWGNLRIKKVSVEDSDLYVCHGLKEYSDLELRQNDHPTVIYRLVVHAPTNVRLTLAANSEKTWQLSCLAHHLQYEIPMVYINGLALIETMNEMGIPPQTNFYTNPINVTLNANNLLSGSVQCISRPAMEEAEIYGANLERGRSINVYVASDQIVNGTNLSLSTQDKIQQSTSALSSTTTTQQSEVLRSELFEVQKPVVFMNVDNARVQWSVEAPDKKLTYLREFVVEFRQQDPMRDNSSSVWTQSDRLPPHVKAVTLRSLNPTYQYQFRVSALFTNGHAEVYSPPSDWIGFVSPQVTHPLIPRITRLQTISHSSILLAWEHPYGSKYNAPEHFIINCSNTESEEIKEIKIGNNSRELLLTELEPGAEYEVTVIAENTAGRSPPSKPRIARTYVIVNDSVDWTILSFNGTAFLAFVTLISAVIPAICFLFILLTRKLYFNKHVTSLRGRSSGDHKGIIREDIFNKNQLYQDPIFLNGDPLEELSPLNYSLDDRENEPTEVHFVEKPFAHIRENGQSLQRGSQMSLNNIRNGFKRLAQRQDIDIYDTSNTALQMPQPLFYENAGSNRHLITSSSFHPGQTPSITRSTLSVFTHPNGRQQAQKRSMAVVETHSPFENEQATMTTTTSLNGGSTDSSPKNQPPLTLPPRGNLRAATSSMELSNNFRSPGPNMRTFVGDSAAASSQSQLYTGTLF